MNLLNKNIKWAVHSRVLSKIIEEYKVKTLLLLLKVKPLWNYNLNTKNQQWKELDKNSNL
jgi:hypothetical protein